MAAVNVNIQPEIISWALNHVQEEKLGDKLLQNVRQWLNGTKTPTFNQIEDFSKKTNIPLGYLFLQTPPAEELELLEYRTINSAELLNPSRDLVDTIYEMEKIKDWMKDYRQELGFDKLSVVGSMNGITDVNNISDEIRKDLDLKHTWFEDCKNVLESFGYIRKKLENSGIIVMMSGVVGKNTHRALNVDEFRAFTMVDDWAPLIFINAADSYGAKLFSLLHEVAHVWLGEDDFYNDRYVHTDNVSAIEKLCNAVAGELLVPKNEFLKVWSDVAADEDVTEAITKIARRFRCGDIVIARKALDTGKINREIYDQVVQKAVDNYNKALQEKESKGGDYYNTMGSRLDRNFVRALCESINMGRISYTEAYRLTNTTRKTFSAVAKRLGGVEW